ncbi:trehalase family glycosidase [Halobium salinum]|uniref:Trehalase family glycosidase n=1 Tax=Halobium salinum TaxID=1364940 RepID=A0ABD5PDG9_9EURY|nr:trehalase family glycosidase [Halobium salinum]
MTDDADTPPTGDDTQARREAALAVLRANRREGYTIPSATLYPFQWNWDSAFVAAGLASADPDAAATEIRTLLDAQWANGMVPQIAFWTDATGYFPGPDEWGAGSDRVRTSGITQPPMVVPAARRVADALRRQRGGSAAEAFLDAVVPALDAFLSWWLRERSDDGDVVYVRHPWATGMDDSPAWTPVLESFEPLDLPGVDDLDYAREDRKSESLADQRPTDWDYDRYVALVRQGRAFDWDEVRLREVCPFVVEDVLTNAIFARACADLGGMYDELDALGEEGAAGVDAADRWREQAESTREACRDRLWSPALGTFVSYDRVGERRLPANSVAGLVSTFGGLPDQGQFEAVRTNLSENFLSYERACPSYVGEGMDLDRYWRGPVWVNTNWLLADGLRRYGAADLASRIERDTVSLVEREGFREYFSPETGEGRGSDRFSWTAALYLDLTD